MKKRIFLLSAIVLAVCVVFPAVLYACGNRHFTELKASYYYDGDNNILVKFPSRLEFEPNELLTYENRRTGIIDYNILDMLLPARDYYTGNFYDYRVSVGYAVHNGRIIFTEIPIQYAPGNTYAIGGRTDAFVLTIDDENAFLIMPDNSDTGYSYEKLFDYSSLDDALIRDTDAKIVFARVISVSPEGRYILYLSNRNYINAGYISSLDIYAYDMQTGAETMIMNFDNKEFLCWETGAEGNFLFREIDISPSTGRRIYSDIRRYSIAQSREDIFLRVAEEYRSYEMIGDRYIYIALRGERSEFDTAAVLARDMDIFIADIYSKEINVVSAGKYSTVWNMKISESKEYLAFFGSYINIEGIAIPEIVTLHIETNDIVAHYEHTEENYYLSSFYWLPDNVLAVNFQNMVNLNRDLCRLHAIAHRGSAAGAADRSNIIPVDG
jgi:hypothetical protein